MSRGLGRVYRPTNGAGRTQGVWWLDYTVGGARHRESSGTTVKKEAQDKLRERIGDRVAGRIIARPEHVLFHALRELHEQDYQLRGLRTTKRIAEHWDHLEEFFGKDTPVTRVTELRLDEYAKARLAGGAARQTVNHELSALRRGFNLAVKKKLLARGATPAFDIPRVDNARQGFFEDGDLAAVLLAVPAWAQPVIRFLRYTGWRITEALTLTWDRVDWEGEVVRLTPAHTKGKRARLFPFASAPDLRALLDARWAAKNGEHVFHRNGAPISYDALQHAFAKVCAAVGVQRIIHDLRRTAVRDFVRAGVDARTVMQLCGWRTPSMLERYHIVNEADLAAAVARRFAENPAASLRQASGRRAGEPTNVSSSVASSV